MGFSLTLYPLTGQKAFRDGRTKGSGRGALKPRLPQAFGHYMMSSPQGPRVLRLRHMWVMMTSDLHAGPVSEVDTGSGLKGPGPRSMLGTKIGVSISKDSIPFSSLYNCYAMMYPQTPFS